MSLTIRPATAADWPQIWALFRHVTAAGDAFAYEADTPEEVARKLWVEPPSVGYVAEDAGTFLGTYFLRPNQPGRGSHVANGGYMVAEAARGRRLAVTLCDHSLDVAQSLGFTAVQFNCVVSTNAAAVRAWERCGFEVVGRLPAAFRHATLGFVDVYVMYRTL
jgi:L-amino acid N-acyltransferase YncA